MAALKPTVFVVEDEALIALELVDRLQARGFRICGQAAHGEHALQQIPTSGADIVLMDIRLAGRMTGLEPARRLRERCDVPVVFLTAFSDGRCLKDADEVGAYGYLVKPFQVDELNATLRTALNRHALERRLKQSNADLHRFAAAISHDLRQPLRAVAGHLELLDRQLHQNPDHGVRERVQMARNAAARMDAMIVGLLEYSSIGEPAIDGQIEAVPVQSSRAALNQAIEFLEPVTTACGASIVIDGDWPLVEVDGSDLVRLFQNLIGNACKFRQVETAPHIRVHATVEGRDWSVAISDNGIGIEPRRLDDVFGVFSRLHGRDRYEGFGLGLAICRRIVERYDGRIRAESKGENLGTTMVFELPDVIVQPSEHVQPEPER